MAAVAAWHLLVVRAEALAEQQTAASPASSGPQLGLALSRIWCTSRVLMAVSKSASGPRFRLPDRLG